MGAMLTMLTTGIKSGPSPDGNGGDGIKAGAAGKSSGGIRSKKVKHFKPVFYELVFTNLTNFGH